MRLRRASAISGTLNGPHLAGSSFTATLGGVKFAIADAYLHEGRFFARINGEEYAAATDWRPGMPILHLREKEREYAMQIAPAAGGWQVSQGGVLALVCVRSLKAADLATLMPKKAAADASKLLLCPMPGLVTSVAVELGQEVKAGEPLIVVEAMKMENVLIAERSGTIGKINVKKGDKFLLNGKEILYQGKCDTWSDCPEGVIVRLGNKLLLNGDLLFEGEFDSWEYDYQNLIVRRGRKLFLWGKDFLCKIPRCPDYKEPGLWQCHPKGVIVRQGRKLLLNGLTALFEGKCDSWKSHQFGVVVQQRKELFLYLCK